jgi:hypothetical protein
VGLQRFGVGDSQQCGIPLSKRATRTIHKPVALRGLNQNHNHDLKSIFKGAAAKASSAAGPFQDFYLALLTKGTKPTMARLTLARKIATISLLVWKKGVCFDAGQLKRQESV